MTGFYEFRLLTKEDLNQLDTITRSSKFLPGRLLTYELGHETVGDYAIELFQLEMSNNGRVYGIFDQQELLAVTLFKDLDWDSQIYGKRMASLEYIFHNENAKSPDMQSLQELLGQIEMFARSEQYDFLLVKAYTNHISLIHALQHSKYLLVDTLLDYTYNYAQSPLAEIQEPTSRSQVTIRDAISDDLDALIQLSELAFTRHYGRYHSDIRTSKEMATNVYKQWTHSSLTGYADRVLIAELDSEIVGYTVWRYPQEHNKVLGRVGHYSIAGIHPKASGQNLFRLLTYHGMQALHGIADYIVGPTHVNNYPVQRGYESLGWRIHDARHSFHKWLD